MKKSLKNLKKVANLTFLTFVGGKKIVYWLLGWKCDILYARSINSWLQ